MVFLFQKVFQATYFKVFQSFYDVRGKEKYVSSLGLIYGPLTAFVFFQSTKQGSL